MTIMAIKKHRPPGGLVPRGPVALSPQARAERAGRQVADAVEAQAAAYAPNTDAAYANDWKMFLLWCTDTMSTDPLARATTDPAGLARLIATYVTALEKGTAHPDGEGEPVPRAASTIARRLSAIGRMLRDRDLPDATRLVVVQRALRAARRRLGKAPNQKAAIMGPDVHLAVQAIPRDARWLRDRALTYVAFGSACRRSELCDVNLGDVTTVTGGMRLRMRFSKTNQAGDLEYADLANGESPDACPCRALADLIAARRKAGASDDDPVFVNVYAGGQRGRAAGQRMSGAAMLRVLRRLAKLAGLDMDPRKIGMHSLRAGHATMRGNRGDSLQDIAQQLRHKSLDTLQKYLRGRPEASISPKGRVL